MPKEVIEVKGKGILDVSARKKALTKINTLNTNELQFIEEMCTPKGRAMLKDNKDFIKSML